MKYVVCPSSLGGFLVTLIAKSDINEERYAGYMDIVDVRGKDIPYKTAKLTVSFGTKEAAWDCVVAGNWVKGDTLYGEKLCTT